MRTQSAIEFLTTYSWAFLVIGLFVVSVLSILALPTSGTPVYLPSFCYISPSFPCYQALVLTNSIGANFMVLFQNNLGAQILFQQPNSIVVTPSLYGGASYGGSCYPLSAIIGATVICNVSIVGNTFSTGTQLSPTFTLIYQICTPRCTKQVYNTSGTATTVAEPYKQVIYPVQLLTSPTTGSIALNGVHYPNGANVIFILGQSYSISAIPPSLYGFSSWSASSNVFVTSTSLQSTTANAVGKGSVTASFVALVSTSVSSTVSTSVSSTSVSSTSISSTSLSTSLSTSISSTSVSSTSVSSLSTTTTTIHYVPITLTNSQSSATQSNFQQQIPFNPSTYGSYANANMSNIEFTTGTGGSGTVLDAWCESGCSNTATSATVWVNLGSSTIGASSSLTIYMNFMSSASPVTNGYTGYAPQLYCASGCQQTSYGQYDNGASVFSFYDNFAGSSLSSKWTELNSGSISLTVSNGVTMQNTAYNTGGGISSSSQSVDNVFEGYAYAFTTTGGSYPSVAVAMGQGQTMPSSGIAPDSSYFTGFTSLSGTSGALKVMSASGASTTLVSSETVPAVPFIMGIQWPQSRKEISTFATSSYSASDSTVSLPSSWNDYLGVSAGSVTRSISFYWARGRVYPPSGTMPSTSFGSVV